MSTEFTWTYEDEKTSIYTCDEEEFEDTKWIIRTRKSKKNRHVMKLNLYHLLLEYWLVGIKVWYNIKFQ